MAVKKDPRTLELADPFVSLFPVDQESLKLVTNSIRELGYQPDKPILVWRDAFGDRGRQVVVDGHTRHRAALDLKLGEIWVTLRQFHDVDAAITAAIGEQVQRRNLNREQIAAYVVAILPKLDPHVTGGLATRTGQELADLLGVGIATVKRARALYGSGRDDLIDAVKDGEMSLLSAYTESTDGQPPAQAPTVTRAILESVRSPEAEQHLAAAADYISVAESDDPEAAAYVKAADLIVEAVDLEAAAPDVAATPDERLNDMHALLEVIDKLTAQLLEIAIGVTVKAAGAPGSMKIAKLQYDLSGAVHALNSTRTKTIAMSDITEVVRLPIAKGRSDALGIRSHPL
jgi:ParB-like chromosome segregation protein Spo0J